MTSVNPGTAIQFVSDRVGWRLDGQDGAPYLDASLAAGPHGTSFAWPGTGVSATDDGGRTWASMAQTDPGGIWGFDLLSDKVGWIVGVTSLFSTSDGGANWRNLGEPAEDGQSLVRVDFLDSGVGYGLTTSGELVRSSDGGSSWTSLKASPSGGVSTCFTSALQGIMSAGDGSVSATADGGDSWTTVAPSPVESQLAPYWSDVVCGPSGVWQSLRILDPLSHGDTPYLLRGATSPDSSWSTVASDSSDDDLPVPQAKPLPGTLVALAQLQDGTSLAVGVPPSAWALDVTLLRSDGTQKGASVPQIDTTIDDASASGYLIVHGAFALGNNAWIYLNDNALGTPAKPATQSLLLASQDGGASWVVLQQGEVHDPPPIERPDE